MSKQQNLQHTFVHFLESKSPRINPTRNQVALMDGLKYLDWVSYVSIINRSLQDVDVLGRLRPFLGYIYDFQEVSDMDGNVWQKP